MQEGSLSIKRTNEKLDYAWVAGAAAFTVGFATTFFLAATTFLGATFFAAGLAAGFAAAFADLITNWFSNFLIFFESFST